MKERTIIKKYGTQRGNKILAEKIWIDMTKEMIIDSWGMPENEKENISRGNKILKCYYGGRKTRQNTTKFKYEVKIKNDIVEGWKELE